MALKLPKKLFHTLTDLKDDWEVNYSDLQQWFMQGDLRASVWLPVMSVFIHNAEKTGDESAFLLHHWEGYIPLSRHQCYRLFGQNVVRLHKFTNMDQSKTFVLPDTSDNVSITLDDLVVLDEERARFEQCHGLTSVSCPSAANTDQAFPFTDYEPSFEWLELEGRSYSFGTVQANVLSLLYRAAKSGKPWRRGKRILEEAGSQDYKLGNLFKHKPIWRKLITSNREGSYRLDKVFFASLQSGKFE